MVLRAAPQDSFAVGRSGDKSNPEALQGFHSPNMLFLLDEASGIDDIVFEVSRDLCFLNVWTGNPDILYLPPEKFIGKCIAQFSDFVV